MVTTRVRDGWNGAGCRSRRITRARAADQQCGGVGSMRSRLVVVADGLEVEERERVRERKTWVRLGGQGRVCAPSPAARLRSQGAGRCVCDLDPRSSLAPGGQIEPLRLALGIRRGGSYPGSLAPRDARGRSSSALTHGLGGWRVGYGLLARLLAAIQTRAEDDQARTSHCAKQGGVV
jgi:hypothetical protein